MSLPRVIVAGGVAVAAALLSPAELADAWERLSCENPARVAAVRADDPRAWRHADRLSSLVLTDDAAIFPAAAASVYRPLLAGKAYELCDTRPTFDRSPLVYRGALLAYQREAVAALCAHTTGGLVAPCGSGKGEMICAIIGEVGMPAIIVVASLDQARELRERIASRLGVPCGLIGGGTFDVQRITVALVQSLDSATLERIADRFGALIVDEGHHAAAESYRAVSLAMKVRRRYWFSATPDREDGLTPFVVHHFGPVRHTVTRAQLVAAGRSVEPRFSEVRTEFSYDYQTRADYVPMLAALIADDTRNRLIVDTVAREGAGQVSAVLTGRVAHADTLRGMLEARGMRACTLTGETPKRERARVILAARASELDVIVGSQVLDEGIDIASLSRVFLTFPAVSEGRLVQRVGRALRVHDDKPAPVVFDFVDARVGLLAHQAGKRRQLFAREWPSSQRLAA